MTNDSANSPPPSGAPSSPHSIVPGTEQRVAEMLACATKAFGEAIQDLVAKNNNSRLAPVLNCLTTGMITLLNERVQQVVAPPVDPSRSTEGGGPQPSPNPSRTGG